MSRNLAADLCLIVEAAASTETQPGSRGRSRINEAEEAKGALGYYYPMNLGGPLK